VVGAGIAGTAAALTAARAGATVSLVASGSGASRLASGALDREPWDAESPGAPLGEMECEVLHALGGFVVPKGGALVATVAGILRPALAIDASLLDLAPLHDGEVLLPSALLPSWDAEALARAYSEAPEAIARRLTFVARPVTLVHELAEHELPDADMAVLHDEPERLAWLAARLAAAIGGNKPIAILLPPWLGVEQSRAKTLTAQLSLPCGETVTGLAGPSGLRFERARDRALAAAGVERSSGRVVGLTCEEGSWSAKLESGETLGPVDAVVLAVGGLVGGGLDYCPSGAVLATELPPAPGPLLRATIDAPLVVGMRGLPLETPASLFGAAPESHAWPFVEDSVLEHAGVLADRDGRVRGAPSGLFAAGDFVADRARTWLEALSVGTRAGATATEEASVPASIKPLRRERRTP
jgi:hypothetical protein